MDIVKRLPRWFNPVGIGLGLTIEVVGRVLDARDLSTYVPLWGWELVAGIIFIFSLVALLLDFQKRLQAVESHPPTATLAPSSKGDGTLLPQPQAWIGPLLTAEERNPQRGVYIDYIGVMWRLDDTTGVYYFDFQVQFFNGSLHDVFAGIKIEGNISFDGTPLLPVPEVNERPAIHTKKVPHSECSYVQLRQDLTALKPVVEKLRQLEGQDARLEFGALRIISELRSPNDGRVVATFPLDLRRPNKPPKVNATGLFFRRPAAAPNRGAQV